MKGILHTPQLTPGSAPDHELQKPTKEFGISQSLGTICSFLPKGKVKRGEGAMAQCPPPPKYAILTRARYKNRPSLRNKKRIVAAIVFPVTAKIF